MSDHGLAYGESRVIRGFLDRYEREQQSRQASYQPRRSEGTDDEGGSTDTIMFFLIFGFLVSVGLFVLIRFHNTCDIWGKFLGLCGVLWLAWAVVAACSAGVIWYRRTG